MFMKETIIEALKVMDVDGETMESILTGVGMQDQMLRQLFMKASLETLTQLFEERQELAEEMPGFEGTREALSSLTIFK